LSSPAQASDGAAVPGNSGAKGGKKSKKGKKVDLTAMMNFRPVGDATRFNAGEIDLDIPAASKKGKLFSNLWLLFPDFLGKKK
jgi:hypothetical protein